MNLPEQRTWKCGRYMVASVLRKDNPAFLQYIVMRGGKVVGYSFSSPDADQCEAIERFAKLGRYVENLSAPKKFSYRMGRPTKAEQQRRAAELLIPAE